MPRAEVASRHLCELSRSNTVIHVREVGNQQWTERFWFIHLVVNQRYENESDFHMLLLFLGIWR